MKKKASQKLAWEAYEKKNPKKPGLYITKFHYKGACHPIWKPWGLAIWNGEGFNFLSMDYARKVSHYALLAEIEDGTDRLSSSS